MTVKDNGHIHTRTYFDKLEKKTMSHRKGLAKDSEGVARRIQQMSARKEQSSLKPHLSENPPVRGGDCWCTRRAGVEEARRRRRRRRRDMKRRFDLLAFQKFP